MSDTYRGSEFDLFDFPQLPDLEEFGLVPPIRGAEVAPAAEAVDVAPASDEATASEGRSTERPTPPIPEGIADLDEDLFGFDELFSLDDDPYFNGTLTADGDPTNPVPAPEPVPTPEAEAPEATGANELSEALPASPNEAPAVQAEDEAPALESATEPQPAAADPTPEPVAAAPQAVAPTGPTETAQPEPARAAAKGPDLFDDPAFDEPLHVATELNAGSARGHSAGQRDRGPRILLPEDVPYGGQSDRSHVLWALVACFLIMNGAILFLAHRANSSFQSTLSDATGVIAEALASGGSAPTHASAPVQMQDLSHTTVRLDDASASPQGAPSGEPWIDPRDYANTHEIAVGTAKAMLQDGRFEESRRLLNHVLANQARVPLSPELREEIDYLIPLTYYEQGKATAPEGTR